MKFTRAKGLLALVGLFAVSAAGAASYTASASGDAGVGSLRQAIIDANASPGADVISVTASSINLSRALPTITEAVTITGLGARLTVVNGFNSARIFVVNNPSGTVVIEKLAIRGNGAGTFTGQGAGIHAQGGGTLQLSQVAVENNRASTDGGGLYTASPTIVNQSTFSGNAATTGGAIAIATPPGARVTVNVTNDSGELPAEVKIVNSTISGNSASSAGAGINLLTAATVAVTNATIAFNNVATAGTGAGINVGVGSGAYSLIATLLALNNDPAADRNCGCSFAACSFISSGFNGVNVDTANSCNFGTGNRVNVMTDATLGVNGAVARVLSPLGNNGGQTDTHAIPVTSPALDYANNVACPSVDQRGEARRTDSNGDGTGTCETGALEAQVFVASSTPTAPSSGGGGGGGGGCTVSGNNTDPIMPALLLAGLAGLWVRLRQRG